MTWQTFWLEPTGRQRVALRRYTRVVGAPWPWTCETGWHQAIVWTDEEIDEVVDERGLTSSPPEPDHDDPRWPAECGKGCGYRFADSDPWQAWGGELFRRTDTGELRVLHTSMCPPDVPAAAMLWRACRQIAASQTPTCRATCRSASCSDQKPGPASWES